MNYFSEEYIGQLKELLDIFPHEQFEKMISAFMAAYEQGKRIFVMGNGGSATTASHWVCDLNKGCSEHHTKKFRMICLNDNVASMMAYANDNSYEDVFVEQLQNFFVPGDVVLAISGSGNSPNVLKAIEYARANQGITIGLSGYDGGRLARLVDIPVVARMHDMQKVEDVHMIIVHMSMQRISLELSGIAGNC